MNQPAIPRAAVHCYFTVVCALIVLCGCVCDDPVGPKPGPREYCFYGTEAVDHDILRFTPSTGEVDTLVHSDSSQVGFVTVWPDGRTLYRWYDGVHVYDLNPFREVRVIPHRGWVVCSPNGQYLAVLGNIPENQPRGIRILRLPDYCEVFANDSLLPLVLSGSFSWDNKTLFFVDGETRDVVRLDATDGFRPLPRVLPQMPGLLTKVIPSVDGKLWFLYSIWNSLGFSFGVYDVATDSVIYRKDMTPGAGEILVSPDGRNVFVTNPGSLLVGPPPPSAFYRYDIPTNSFEEISTAGWSQIPGVDSLPVGPMAISPDARTLVLTSSYPGEHVVVFDVPSLTITASYFWDWSPMFLDINSQVSNQ